jgi:hypothetical protein
MAMKRVLKNGLSTTSNGSDCGNMDRFATHKHDSNIRSYSRKIIRTLLIAERV